ncbi:MAG: threonine synthase, partial [Gemmatimonadetes bacterium]|nr:threonine synthase [Gemmatimonadota bacterium]
MRFISTRPPFSEVSLRHAVLDDPAPNGALYQPIELPRLSIEELAGMDGPPFPKLAERLALLLFASALGEGPVRRIARRAFDFPVPVVRLDPDTWILELFHGPTGSFKDFGARFLAHLLSALRGPEDKPVVILVATSGDTGGAVAHAVHGLPGVRAVVLYPRDRLSPVQRRQIQEPATWAGQPGTQVIPVEVRGTFDDCQRMVKDVLARPGPTVEVALTSANSVNVGRLLPQAFYYVHGWNSLPHEVREGVTVSVPSGNLGNLTAGLLAKEMGVPFGTFVAASNANAAMSRFYETGQLAEGPSLQTVSNAMDVARPSNLERLLAVCDRDVSSLRGRVLATHHEDAEVLDAMTHVHRTHGYFMDPHTAVGYLGLGAF